MDDNGDCQQNPDNCEVAESITGTCVTPDPGYYIHPDGPSVKSCLEDFYVCQYCGWNGDQNKLECTQCRDGEVVEVENEQRC